MTEEIKAAYEKYEAARKVVFDPDHRENMVWNSPAQKDLKAAKDEFVDVVRKSEYYDYFDLYADEVYRWS